MFSCVANILIIGVGVLITAGERSIKFSTINVRDDKDLLAWPSPVFV